MDNSIIKLQIVALMQRFSEVMLLLDTNRDSL
jgi:hypothetical protein